MSDGNNSLDSLCEDAEVETAGGTNHKTSKRPLSRPVSSKPVNLVQCSNNHNDHNNQIPPILSPSPDFQSRPQSSQDDKLDPPALFKSETSVPSSDQENIQVEVEQQSNTQQQFEFCCNLQLSQFSLTKECDRVKIRGQFFSK